MSSTRRIGVTFSIVAMAQNEPRAMTSPPEASRQTSRSPMLGGVPVVDVFLGLVFGVAVPLLDLAFELITASGDHIKVIIRELAPLLLDLAFDLLPISFDTIPIHSNLLSVSSNARSR